MEKIVRRGIVSAVYPERHSARLTFEDEDDLVSEELPILVPAASKNNFYRLPDVGEMCVCLYEQTDAGEGTGVIIGSLYNEINVPKVNSQDKTRIDFDGGSFIEVDRAGGNMTIHCTGNFKVTASRIDLN